MDLSIVVVSWNTRELLARCLSSVFSTVRRSFELFVVDNASADGSAGMVEARFPACRLIRNRGNHGFARANNQALGLARGEHVLFLNSDAQLLEGTADGMAAFLDAHPRHGAAACRLLNEDGSVQRACRRFPTFGTLLARHSPLRYRSPGRALLARWYMSDWDFQTNRDVDQPAAACLMVRREVLARIGPFDTGLSILYNDVDLCRRIRRKGHAIAYVSGLSAIHRGSASLDQLDSLREIDVRNALHYVRKYYGPGMACGFGLAVVGARGWSGDWKGALRILRHA